jgi:hypothetical protein
MQAKERAPTPFSFVVFTLGLTFEFFKEFGGALICTRYFYMHHETSPLSMSKTKMPKAKLILKLMNSTFKCNVK